MARLLTLWLAALAVVGCKGACSGGEPQVATLQLFGDPAELAAYSELVAAFEAQDPKHRVRLVPVGKPSEHMRKLLTAFSGGTPPDVFLLNYRRFGQLAARGVLEPLGPKVGDELALSLDAFFPQAVEAFRYDGTLTCLPQNISSLVVYFNKGLFQRRGVPLPEAGWSWDDFTEAAKRLTDRSAASPADHVHGVGFEPYLPKLAPFVWQAGGRVVDDVDRPTRLMLDVGPAVKALRFLLALRRLHEVTPSLQEVAAEDLESRFARGKLGMLLHSRRFTPTARSIPGLDWDVAPLPVGERPASILHSDAYCVSRDSKAKEAAYAFITFALSPRGAEIIARSGRTVPSLRSVAQSPAFLDPAQRPASSRVFLDAIPHLQRLPNIASWHEIEARSEPLIEEWFYGPDVTRYGLAGPPAAPDGGPAPFPGSLKYAVRMGDELTILAREIREATAGLWPEPK